VNPQNAMNRWDMAHGFWLLGDALFSSDRAGAIRAYEESVALSEALIASGVNSPAPDLVSVRQRLGLIAARDGNRDRALSHARRALEISDPTGPFARGRAESVQRFLTPRGTAAMGLIYAALARSPKTPPDLARADESVARDWLRKSLTGWHELQADPAFSPAHKNEMQLVEAAIAGLRK
jgi:tetratricopeptide (TPR) repeat protein